MDQLHFKSAVEIARLIREREVRAVEALEHFLARIEKYNPKLNAVIWLDARRAAERAKAADAALAKGEVWGPLHGVPMTIKESYNVAGSPTTWGDPKLANNVTETSALAAERLEKAGAILFGKTNVPLMLADWQSYNAIYGTTNNPWDVTRTPGGSSGGSAAALAAGLTGLEAGSDIGGSIRNPAHYCGVFGLKPTWGVASPKGQALPGTHADADISVIGPLARGAADLDLALRDGGARRDRWRCLEARSAPVQRELAGRPAHRRKAARSQLRCRCRICRQTSSVGGCGRQAWSQGEEIEPKVDTVRLHEVYVLLLRAATSLRTREADVKRWGQTLSEIGAAKAPYLDLMVRGNTLPHRDWLKLNNERHGLRRAFAAFFADWDILLCPAAASAAWPHDQEGERWQRKIAVNGDPVASTDQLFWAGYASLVYLPAAVGPAGLAKSGLPVGYQAIAASGRDKTATAFSRFLEKEIVGFVPPPGFD